MGWLSGETKERLRGIRHLALDMDGTIYLGGQVFPTTTPFLAFLRERGIGYSFLTNNSSHSRREYLAKLQRMGVPATAEHVYISTHATAAYLKQHYPKLRKVFVLGTPAMREEMGELGFEIVEGTAGNEGQAPEAVVVGFDRTLTYERLCRAAWWIQQGRPFLASNPDRVCPTDEPTVLVDCGSMCQMLAWATGVQPVFIGKPDPRMLEGLQMRYGLEARELAMVGDRLSTDMALAKTSGAVGILVLTGEATRAEAEASEWKPEVVARDLVELAALLKEAGAGSHGP